MLALKRKNLMIGGLVMLLVIAMLALVAAPRALANGEPTNAEELCVYDGFVLDVGIASEGAIEASFGPFVEGSIVWKQYITSAFGLDVYLVYQIGKEVAPGQWEIKTLTHISGCEASLPAAPAIFLSDVCEPIDGFSSDGWQTWDSDSDEPLYVAPSAEGPWHLTEYAQPPYVISTEAAAGLTSWMGAASYGDLWFKAGESGYAVNVGSAVADRAGNMDAICGN